MSPRNTMSIPPEIHLTILEMFLSDKSLYNPIEQSFSYTSVSKWIGLALVCRSWRDRIHTLAFRHLSVPYKILAELRDLVLLSGPYGDLLPTASGFVHPPTLNYIHDLTLELGPTDYLPEVISLLSALPDLNNLTIDIMLHYGASYLYNSTHSQHKISQVKRLGLRVSHPAREIDLRSTGVNWILSCFSSVEHLFLYLPRAVDDSYLDLTLHHSLPPNLISLVSTDWFYGLFGRQLAIPTLRFLEIWFPTADVMRPFADYHCNTLEGLRLVHMSINEDRVCDDILPKFSSLRYLSVGDEARYASLERIKSQHLRHFGFNLYNTEDGLENLAGITKFVTEDCPNLRVVTYHNHVRSEPMHDLEKASSLSVVWKPSFTFSPLEDECPYAIPYTRWEDTVSPDEPFPPVRRT
ncbi:hypothetical protein BDV93DRAFT_612386 [Ceratobasidium sp. AG-I]|nr:hypothetical protein BDV93DRAFT_612387 [Ceratobasidium sp. AG-I]KAF8592976.1 hypothetical protein BDV93DRAFT_612386 [Ceratobasidium sp. AG-I]